MQADVDELGERQPAPSRHRQQLPQAGVTSSIHVCSQS